LARIVAGIKKQFIFSVSACLLWTGYLGPPMAYTSRMKWLISVLLAIYPLVATTAIAQVKISVPRKQYKVHEEIHAKIENTGNNAITFCVEFGQTSMIGPNVGSARGAAVLEAGGGRGVPFSAQRFRKNATQAELLA